METSRGTPAGVGVGRKEIIIPGTSVRAPWSFPPPPGSWKAVGSTTQHCASAGSIAGVGGGARGALQVMDPVGAIL